MYKYLNEIHSNFIYKGYNKNINKGVVNMGIVLITAGIVTVMYGLTFLSYLSENHILDDVN